MLRAEGRWLTALTVLWLLGPLWLLRVGADTDDLLEDPPVGTIRVLALLLTAGTLLLTFLHVRANRGSRPLAKAILTTVLLGALGWGAWIWTLDGHRGSGTPLAVPLCLVALALGALAGSRPAVDERPAANAH